MKKVTAVVAMFVFLLLGTVRLQAQTEVLWGLGGFLLGSVLSGDGTQASPAGIGGGTIFVLPGLAKRLNPDDWLLVKQLCVSKKFSVWEYKSGAPVYFPDSETLQDLFRKWMKKQNNVSSDSFAVLQVTKILNPKDPEHAYFWFFYIEKSKLKPLPAQK